MPTIPSSLTSNQKQDSTSYIGETTFKNIFGGVSTGEKKIDFLQIAIVAGLAFIAFKFLKK